jgi:hypothetical protein
MDREMSRIKVGYGLAGLVSRQLPRELVGATANRIARQLQTLD